MSILFELAIATWFLAGRAAADLRADHFATLKFAVKITNHYSSLSIQPNTFGAKLI
jgi:hypothetical protein